MPRRITVPTTPSAGPSEPRRSGRVSHPPGYYRQLARDDRDDAEHLDFVFSAGYDDLFAAALDNLEGDPKSLTQAQSHDDCPQWKTAMDREMATLERAGTWRESEPFALSTRLTGASTSTRRAS